MNPTHIALGTLALSLLTFLANFLLAPSRAKQQALRVELDGLKGQVAKNASDLSHHELRLSGLVGDMERKSDHLLGQINHHADKHEKRCKDIESELKQINNLREDVATLKAKIDGQAEALREIKELQGKMFDLLRAPSKN